MTGDIPMVIKADGTPEPFDEATLAESLRNSGATDDDIHYIIDHIKNELIPGTRTATIYRHAFTMLKDRNSSVAARYSLRRSLAELGPTGFPFEKFVGQLLERQGFTVDIGVNLAGKCTSHEVDVMALKGDRLVMAEVKFHNESNIKSDTKVALYVRARFEDLLASSFDNYTANKSVIPEGWLVTNTKFTSAATDYGNCVGLSMIGWDYPEKGHLRDLIEGENLQPVTVVTSLNQDQKKELVTRGVVLCQTLIENPNSLKEMGLTEDHISSIMREIDGVCHPTS